MENTVADYSTRLKALKLRHTYLQVAKQPKARDAKDEFDTDVSKLDTLTRRQEAAKRAAEAAKADAMEAEHIKIHLQQSIDQLTKYVLNLLILKRSLQSAFNNLNADGCPIYLHQSQSLRNQRAARSLMTRSLFRGCSKKMPQKPHLLGVHSCTLTLYRWWQKCASSFGCSTLQKLQRHRVRRANALKISARMIVVARP
jgi:hypothetical protein